MKKKISLLLVAVMTLSLVASACGKKEEKTEEKPQQHYMLFGCPNLPAEH